MGSQPPKKKQRTVISFDAVRISGPFSQSEDGELQIEGVFEGCIVCHALIIPEGGTAKGDVKADWVVVQGNFSGNIETNFFTATKDAIVLGGEITVYEKVLIEPGCLFRGDLTRPGESGNGEGARLSWTDEVAAQGARPLAISQRSLPEADLALVESVQKGESETVERLLLAGASPSATDASGVPVLLTAVTNAKAEIARLLLDAGADPGLAGAEGLTALMSATELGATAVAEELLGHGADPNAAQADGTTPLILAVRRGRTEIARALLAAGADLHVQNEAGEIPMLLAKQRGYQDTFDLLKRAAAGQDPTLMPDAEPEPSQPEPAVERAPAKTESEPAPKAVPNHGPAAADDKFNLFEALDRGDSALLDELIQRGADPNQVDDSGNTVLMRAVKQADAEAIDCLLQRGADPNAATDDGETALLVAAIGGSLALTRRLLEQGADPNAARADGSTPLIEAARLGRTEVARQLIGAGAQLHVRNAKGETPMALADELGFKDTVVLFRQAAKDAGEDLTAEPKAAAATPQEDATAGNPDRGQEVEETEETPAAPGAGKMGDQTTGEPDQGRVDHESATEEPTESGDDAHAPGTESVADERSASEASHRPETAAADDPGATEEISGAEEPSQPPAEGEDGQPNAPLEDPNEAGDEPTPGDDTAASTDAAESRELPHSATNTAAPVIDDGRHEDTPQAEGNLQESATTEDDPNAVDEAAAAPAGAMPEPEALAAEPAAEQVAVESAAVESIDGDTAMPALKGFMGLMAPGAAPSSEAKDPSEPPEAGSPEALEDPATQLLEPDEVDAMRLRLAQALAPFTLASVGGAAANGDGEADGPVAEADDRPDWQLEEINDLTVAHASLPRPADPEPIMVTVVKTSASPDSEPLRVDVYLSEAGADPNLMGTPEQSSVSLFQADRSLIFWPIGFQRVEFNDEAGTDLFFCDDDGNWSRRTASPER